MAKELYSGNFKVVNASQYNLEYDAYNSCKNAQVVTNLQNCNTSVHKLLKSSVCIANACSMLLEQISSKLLTATWNKLDETVGLVIRLLKLVRGCSQIVTNLLITLDKSSTVKKTC